MIYKVKYTETKSVVLDIEAETPEQAKQIMRDTYPKGFGLYPNNHDQYEERVEVISSRE